ncbi:MAG: hypothetical protein R3Y43_06170 [Alphaproteobacteria bacterium]
MDINNIFEELVTCKFSETQKVSEIQTKIYQALQTKQNNVDLMILLMQTHIMLGKKDEAIALSNKIWEEADEVNLIIYSIYVDNLMSLGLLAKAEKVLTPFIEDLEDAPEEFRPLLLKFAMMKGDLNILNKLNEQFYQNMETQEVSEVANMLKFAKYEEHFKNTATIILSIIKEKMLSTEILFFDDEEETSWHWIVYIAGDLYDISELEGKVKRSIDEYFSTNDPEFQLAPFVGLLNISEHFPLSQD